MARLNKKTAEETAKAENTFEALPEGWYHLRLRNVDSSKSGSKGPYWVWEFEVVGSPDGKGYKRRVWTNVSLSSASAGVRKTMYDAFGVSPDVDTDDLCGQIIQGQLRQETQQQGKNAGNLINVLGRVKPKDPEFVLPEELATTSAASSNPANDPDDVFG